MTSCTQNRHATKLRYISFKLKFNIIILSILYFNLYGFNKTVNIE